MLKAFTSNLVYKVGFVLQPILLFIIIETLMKNIIKGFRHVSKGQNS